MFNENQDFINVLQKKSPALFLQIKSIKNIDFRNEISLFSKIILNLFEKAQSPNDREKISSFSTLSVYISHNILLKTSQLEKSFLLLIDNNLLVPAFSLSRMIFEHWSAIVFVQDLIENYLTNRNQEKLKRTSFRLFAGVKYPVTLPWGKLSSEKPIHINDMLRKLELILPETFDTYDFLSEYTHPNNLLSMYSIWASINWHDNPLFDNQIVNDVGKIVSIIITTLKSIKYSANHIGDIIIRECSIV